MFSKTGNKERAEFPIMPLSADVDTEPLDWPIAPDGYIPNSVIRSWRKKRRELSQPHSGEHTSHDLHNSNECTTSSQDNGSTSTVWFVEDEEDEDETLFEMEQEMSGDEKNENKEDRTRKNKTTGKDKKIIGIFKARIKQKPETGENETGEFVRQQEYDTQADNTQRKHSKVSDGTSVDRFQTGEVDTRDSPENTGIFLPTGDENGHHPPRKQLKIFAEFCETVTPPLQDLCSLKEHEEPNIIPTEWPKPSVKRCAVSADAVNLKRGGCYPVYIKSALDVSTRHLPTQLLSDEPPLPQPPPPSPEDLQNQLKMYPPKGFSVEQHSFHMSSSKCNMKDQAQLALSLKVLALYKKFKASNTNLSHRGKPTTFEHSSKLFSAHRNSFYLNLRSEVNSPASEFRVQINSKGTGEQNSGPPSVGVALSSVHSHPSSNVQSDRTFFPGLINNPVLIQSLHPDECNSPVPEWRKTLHELISHQGFRSSQAAGRYAIGHPAGSPSVTQPTGTIPSLQHDQAAPHQRVVQKIELKDATELHPSCFNYIISMAAQQNFCTLRSCGKTQYGQLQFEWKRGSEEEKLLIVPPLKLQHGLH